MATAINRSGRGTRDRAQEDPGQIDLFKKFNPTEPPKTDRLDLGGLQPLQRRWVGGVVRLEVETEKG